MADPNKSSIRVPHCSVLLLPVSSASLSQMITEAVTNTIATTTAALVGTAATAAINAKMPGTSPGTLMSAFLFDCSFCDSLLKTHEIVCIYEIIV
jgi:hypothetical protein